MRLLQEYGHLDNRSGANVSTPVSVECSAEAEVEASSSAVNAQATATGAFIQETCALQLDPKPLEKHINSVASAIAEVQMQRHPIVLPIASIAQAGLLPCFQSCKIATSCASDVFAMYPMACVAALSGSCRHHSLGQGWRWRLLASLVPC